MAQVGDDLSPASQQGYTGHVGDNTGLVYMQARYYDPVIGRFYSNDPLGYRGVHSFNRYAYANNNPYKYIDPDGRDATRIGQRLDLRVQRLTSGEINTQQYNAENMAEAAGGLGAVSLLIPGPEDIALAGVLGRASTIGRGKQVGNMIKADGSTKASDIKSKAGSVGFKPTQSGNGPLKMVDENGTARVTIKGGSERAPGSRGPHVELKDSSGQRVNPAGEPVTRRSPENHTPIRNDLR